VGEELLSRLELELLDTPLLILFNLGQMIWPDDVVDVDLTRLGYAAKYDGRLL